MEEALQKWSQGASEGGRPCDDSNVEGSNCFCRAATTKYQRD